MSYVFRTYGCGNCEKTFELMQERDEPPPSFCPHCGESFGDDLEPIPSKIAIGGAPIVEAVDKTYRWAEESSRQRAEDNNAPHLKITNMRDNLREGDVAALPPDISPQMKFYMEQSQQGPFSAGYGFQGPAATVGEAHPHIASDSGRFVGPGHIALQAAQGPGGTHHAQRRAQIEAVGKQQYKERK